MTRTSRCICCVLSRSHSSRTGPERPSVRLSPSGRSARQRRVHRRRQQLSAAHAVRQARTLLAQLRPRTSGTASNEASASQQQRALATCRPAVATLSPPRKIAHADQRPRASQNIAAQERQQDSVNAAAVSEETDTESDSDGVEVDPELAARIWASMKRSLTPLTRPGSSGGYEPGMTQI